jgi:phosphoglycolate phosphatase
VLAALAADGIAVGLCTNKPQAATLALLSGLGIADYFGAVVGGDALAGVRKPDARHVLAVLERLGAAPHEAVMVGDSPIDVQAGRDAGLRVIAVTFGYPLGPVESLGADRLIDRFDELTGVLATL